MFVDNREITVIINYIIKNLLLKYILNISSERHGMEATSSFALKCIQKDQPFKILTITFICIGLIFGILLRMFEM